MPSRFSRTSASGSAFWLFFFCWKFWKAQYLFFFITNFMPLMLGKESSNQWNLQKMVFPNTPVHSSRKTPLRFLHFSTKSRRSNLQTKRPMALRCRKYCYLSQNRFNTLSCFVYLRVLSFWFNVNFSFLAKKSHFLIFNNYLKSVLIFSVNLIQNL